MHPDDIPSPHDPIDTYYYCRDIMNRNGLLHWRLTFAKQKDVLNVSLSEKSYMRAPESNFKAFCTIGDARIIALNPNYYGEGCYFSKNEIKETIFHEIAHAICYEKSLVDRRYNITKGTGHHKLWQLEFERFGYNSQKALDVYNLGMKKFRCSGN